MMWPWMWGGWGGMGAGMLFFWLMICAGGFYFFRGWGWPRRRYRYDPREIVRERYAKGELSKEEYEEIKKNLSYD